MAALADLEVLIGPPTMAPPPVDWPALERLSGLVFPEDYKALAGRYGTLEIDAFLDVHHVGMPADMSRMLRQRQETLGGLRQLQEDLGFIYVDTPCLLAVGYPCVPIRLSGSIAARVE